jgi:hypothetical protein
LRPSSLPGRNAEGVIIVKVCLDFITNSSSASFLIGRKNDGKLSAKAKEQLITLLLEQFSIAPGNRVETVESDEDEDEDVQSAVEEGYEVVRGYVLYEEADNQLGDLAEKVLHVLENEPNYKVISNDVSY